MTQTETKCELERLRRIKAGELCGYVYFLKSPAGLWKIGRSKRPFVRAKQFQGCELVHAIYTDDAPELEANLHGAFSNAPHQRMHGEWFSIHEGAQPFGFLMGISDLSRPAGDIDIEIFLIANEIAQGCGAVS